MNGKLQPYQEAISPSLTLATRCDFEMKILLLYNATQTYTNTVYEHTASFSRYSKNFYFFANADQHTEFNVDLRSFDAIAIHYSVRLPYNQISKTAEKALTEYQGLKILFIQDEYDHTKLAWQWIRRLGIDLVFTVVPPASIESVYPKSEFPGTSFESNLTGYIPDILTPTLEIVPPSQRSLMVGYRGRPLPIRYGQLGFEKVAIGKMVKSYCDEHGIKCDIAWTEDARIYGSKWYEFMASCRGMLGSESGSNIFDWDGDLNNTIDQAKRKNPHLSDVELYLNVIKPLEIDGLMNQLSPRIFEAIASRTVLILFEGSYSGVVNPWEHFIPLKKDGSNLDEVVARLLDDKFVDEISERAYRHVISSNAYSYKSFMLKVDDRIERKLREIAVRTQGVRFGEFSNLTSPPSFITTHPIRAMPPLGPISFPRRLALSAWAVMPDSFRRILHPYLRPLFLSLR